MCAAGWLRMKVSGIKCFDNSGLCTVGLLGIKVSERLMQMIYVMMENECHSLDLHCEP